VQAPCSWELPVFAIDDGSEQPVTSVCVLIVMVDMKILALVDALERFCAVDRANILLLQLEQSLRKLYCGDMGEHGCSGDGVQAGDLRRLCVACACVISSLHRLGRTTWGRSCLVDT
jgi:hypothetical protein